MNHLAARTIGAAASLAVVLATQAPASAAEREPVLTFADLTQVGTSHVERSGEGVSFSLTTSQLEPGNAYTLWLVVFNNPDGCQAPTPISSCSAADVGNLAAMPDIVYGTGHVAGGSGQATFSGHRRAGDDSGSITDPIGLPAFGLVDSEGAEIHLVLHEHGPKLARYLPDMIHSVAGGCIEAGIPEPGVASPFNAYTGPEYGERGPNTCRSIHFAVHQP
jgi:hypothetical protein